MVGNQKLRTQTEQYWATEYKVSEDDYDLMTGIILESATPQRLDSLASSVMVQRFRREGELAAQQAQRGQVYRPADRFEAGQKLFFSAFEAVGSVVAVREGHNPEQGTFEVIRVAFEDDGEEREYAAGFDHPHTLNRPVEELLVAGDSDITEDDIVRLFGQPVAQRIEGRLEESEDFVFFSGAWFLKGLLPEIHIGHLNLAEALIDHTGHPLNAGEMLASLDLGAADAEGTPTDAQLFALNHALSQDDRFDNLSAPLEAPVWYLRALVPDAAFARPSALEVDYRTVGGEYIGITMLDLIEQTGDELDDLDATPETDFAEMRYEVIFPHLASGTMPAPARFLRQTSLGFESGAPQQHHYPITFVDANSKKRFEAWVVPQEHYVCGLGKWYSSASMYTGGQVTVSPTGEPLTFTLSFAKARSRRSEWVRSAAVTDDALTLQMQRVSVPVRCDPDMLIDVPDRDAVVARREMLKAEIGGAPPSLPATVRRAFAELAKLSSQGTVHAKSLYSMVNLSARMGAVPIFAELARSACFDPVGDGQWAHDEELNGISYVTPDEMRERPQSNRVDLVRDQVVQYSGR